jgi:hypothetical protein
MLRPQPVRKRYFGKSHISIKPKCHRTLPSFWKNLSPPPPWSDQKQLGNGISNNIPPDNKIAFHSVLAFILEQNKGFCLAMEKRSGNSAFGFELSSVAHPSLSQGSDVGVILERTAAFVDLVWRR